MILSVIGREVRSCRLGSTAGASRHLRLWETERHVEAARKRGHQWCLTLDPMQYWNNYWKNDMSLFSATNQERPYEQLLHNLNEPRSGWESSFSLKIRPILIPASAIANNGVTIRDLIGRDEKTRGRGRRKVSTTNFKGGYVKTRCLRNQRFLSSDEYCVKETNEEKKEKYHGAFYRIVGFAGKRFLFPPSPPPSFLFSWLLFFSNFRPKTRSERFASLCTVQPPLAT